ncbi:hypothetical protein [Streptomyces cyaneofuscatus]|uniref:hypothetical protein n=1 Tax=Streptomyces cyaneofuscatus TaxID=66883 RepID=UPI0033AE0897
MPFLTGRSGVVVGLVATAPGLLVEVSAQTGTDVDGVPPGGVVVGWVLIGDEGVAGGARVDPVFLAAGRAWTPDQFRQEHGQHLALVVGRADA